jgi:hypothetical protein
MRGKNRSPGLDRLKSNRTLWVCILIVLALGVWPGSAILASPLLSGQVGGEIHLQGRSDHSGVEIQIQQQPGSGNLESFSVPPTQVTGTEGAFNFDAQGVLIITAHKPGYLDAQATVEIAPDAPIDLQPATLYGGEVTGDNLIDISDLAYLGANFGSNDSQGDINGDGQVDILDMSVAAANYMMRGPTPWGE